MGTLKQGSIHAIEGWRAHIHVLETRTGDLQKVLHAKTSLEQFVKLKKFTPFNMPPNVVSMFTELAKSPSNKVFAEQVLHWVSEQKKK